MASPKFHCHVDNPVVGVVMSVNWVGLPLQVIDELKFTVGAVPIMVTCIVSFAIQPVASLTVTE